VNYKAGEMLFSLTGSE